MQDYLSRHPEIVVIDPLDSIYRLGDRHQQYKFAHDCSVQMNHGTNILYMYMCSELAMDDFTKIVVL